MYVTRHFGYIRVMTDDQSSDTPDKMASSPYRDKRTARFAAGERVKEFQGVEQQAKKLLLILQEAVSR